MGMGNVIAWKQEKFTFVEFVGINFNKVADYFDEVDKKLFLKG